MKKFVDKTRNLTEDEFLELFDHILIEHYHKQDYSGARKYVFTLSEEDREKFNSKFISGHSSELLKKHFTDFENVNQEEFKESVFKVTGKVENIPIPPLLFDDKLIQFTNHSFINENNNETLYLVKDIHDNQYFLDHLMGNHCVLLESKDFNTDRFSKNYKIELISDVLNISNILTDMYSPQLDYGKIKEQLNAKTVQEKKDIGDITLKIVLHSHLSDAIVELQNKNPELVESRLDFCKHLISKYGDLDIGIKEVDLNNLWTKVWESKHKIEVDQSVGLLTVDKALDYLKRSDDATIEIKDGLSYAIKLFEIGDKQDNYVIENVTFAEENRHTNIENAIQEWNDFVKLYGVNSEISFNENKVNGLTR